MPGEILRVAEISSALVGGFLPQTGLFQDAGIAGAAGSRVEQLASDPNREQIVRAGHLER